MMTVQSTPHFMVVKQPTKLSLTLLAQLLDVVTIIHGKDYTSALTNTEYTTTFEMGHRLAVDGWTVTSIITTVLVPGHILKP